MAGMRSPAWMRVVGLALLGSFATCDSLDNFDVEQSGQSTVPAATPLDPLLEALPFDAFSNLDFSQDFANQGVTKDDVDSVRLVSMKLEITDPPGATFDFLDSIVFSMRASGEPPIEIARMDAVPAGATEILLDVREDAELEPYVVAAELEIVSDVEGSLPPQKTTVKATVVLDVDVTIPGC